MIVVETEEKQTITIQHTSIYPQGDAFCIYLKTGEYYLRRAKNVYNTNDNFTYNIELFDNDIIPGLNIDNIFLCCWVYYARFDNDGLTIKYITPKIYSTSVNVIEIFGIYDTFEEDNFTFPSFDSTPFFNKNWVDWQNSVSTEYNMGVQENIAGGVHNLQFIHAQRKKWNLNIIEINSISFLEFFKNAIGRFHGFYFPNLISSFKVIRVVNTVPAFITIRISNLPFLTNELILTASRNTTWNGNYYWETYTEVYYKGEAFFIGCSVYENENLNSTNKPFIYELDHSVYMGGFYCNLFIYEPPSGEMPNPYYGFFGNDTLQGEYNHPLACLASEYENGEFVSYFLEADKRLAKAKIIVE